jgi:hypothetical protein
MNTIAVIERNRNRVVSYQARIQVLGRTYAFTSMSEAGVRTWLAHQGIPFRAQPELTRGN